MGVVVGVVTGAVGAGPPEEGWARAGREARVPTASSRTSEYRKYFTVIKEGMAAAGPGVGAGLTRELLKNDAFGQGGGAH